MGQNDTRIAQQDFIDALYELMAITGDTGIDLYRSVAVLGCGSSNEWMASIESVYLDHGNAHFVLLTKNCQTENVSDRQKIFEGKRATFRELISERGNFVIRSGPGIYHPLNMAASEVSHYQEVGQARTKMWKASIANLPFDVFRRKLLDDIAALNYLHIRFDWEEDGTKKTLLTRSQYVNFNRGLVDRVSFDFVQPICGEIGVEYEGRHRVAYIAALVGPDGVYQSELILEDSVGLFKTKIGYLGKRSYLVFNKLTAPFRRFLMTDAYVLRHEIRPRVTFYIARPSHDDDVIAHRH